MTECICALAATRVRDAHTRLDNARFMPSVGATSSSYQLDLPLFSGGRRMEVSDCGSRGGRSSPSAQATCTYSLMSVVPKLVGGGHVQRLQPLLGALLEGSRVEQSQDSPNRVLARYPVRQCLMPFQPCLDQLGPVRNRRGTIGRNRRSIRRLARTNFCRILAFTRKPPCAGATGRVLTHFGLRKTRRVSTFSKLQKKRFRLARD